MTHSLISNYPQCSLQKMKACMGQQGRWADPVKATAMQLQCAPKKTHVCCAGPLCMLRWAPLHAALGSFSSPAFPSPASLGINRWLATTPLRNVLPSQHQQHMAGPAATAASTGSALPPLPVPIQPSSIFGVAASERRQAQRPLDHLGLGLDKPLQAAAPKVARGAAGLLIDAVKRAPVPQHA